MSAVGWATCGECNRRVRELVCWPDPVHAIKHVCRSCYAGLRASSEWVRSSAGNTANYAYKLPPATTSTPLDSVPSLPITLRRRLNIPEGCEYRFLWLWWMRLTGRISEGVRECADL